MSGATVQKQFIELCSLATQTVSTLFGSPDACKIVHDAPGDCTDPDDERNGTVLSASASTAVLGRLSVLRSRCRTSEEVAQHFRVEVILRNIIEGAEKSCGCGLTTALTYTGFLLARWSQLASAHGANTAAEATVHFETLTDAIVSEWQRFSATSSLSALAGPKPSVAGLLSRLSCLLCRSNHAQGRAREASLGPESCVSRVVARAFTLALEGAVQRSRAPGLSRSLSRLGPQAHPGPAGIVLKQLMKSAHSTILPRIRTLRTSGRSERSCVFEGWAGFVHPVELPWVSACVSEWNRNKATGEIGSGVSHKCRPRWLHSFSRDVMSRRGRVALVDGHLDCTSQHVSPLAESLAADAVVRVRDTGPSTVPARRVTSLQCKGMHSNAAPESSCGELPDSDHAACTDGDAVGTARAAASIAAGRKTEDDTESESTYNFVDIGGELHGRGISFVVCSGPAAAAAMEQCSARGILVLPDVGSREFAALATAVGLSGPFPASTAELLACKWYHLQAGPVGGVRGGRSGLVRHAPEVVVEVATGGFTAGDTALGGKAVAPPDSGVGSRVLSAAAKALRRSGKPLASASAGHGVDWAELERASGGRVTKLSQSSGANAAKLPSGTSDAYRGAWRTKQAMVRAGIAEEEANKPAGSGGVLLRSDGELRAAVREARRRDVAAREADTASNQPWLVAIGPVDVASAGGSAPIQIILRHPSTGGSHLLQERVSRGLARLACALRDGYLVPGGGVLDAMAVGLMRRAQAVPDVPATYHLARQVLEGAHSDMLLQLGEVGSLASGGLGDGSASLASSACSYDSLEAVLKLGRAASASLREAKSLPSTGSPAAWHLSGQCDAYSARVMTLRFGCEFMRNMLRSAWVGVRSDPRDTGGGQPG